MSGEEGPQSGNADKILGPSVPTLTTTHIKFLSITTNG